MGTHAGSVMTLANSIIGVSVLAMPFCFKQCGIVLSIVMLLVSSIVSRLASHYLIKAAIMEKRRNFEMLAFRAFGPTGKLMVELCVIGFMLGTCVAYFVVVGDLGPAIMAPILGFQHPTALRPSVLIGNVLILLFINLGVAVFVVLPLGLLRNVDSLSTVSAASIAFYSCLVLKVGYTLLLAFTQSHAQVSVVQLTIVTLQALAVDTSPLSPVHSCSFTELIPVLSRQTSICQRQVV
ncbi:hypothetical protein AAG570_013377 [Ranatra chinensis]|uniref:Amino acid transporter transmembrane domain-containing protein n=1 Tax=Ranatra chinensis TaxID=642074 RepID=A0ABD0YYE2_9HEMI